MFTNYRNNKHQHKKNGKQGNKIQTTIMNVNNDVYLYRDFEKTKSRIFAFKSIHQTVYSAI